jgi:hypothetical protein
MCSEIKLRRSLRLNKESDSSPEEEKDECDFDYLKIIDNNVDFIEKRINCFGIIPVLYSLYNGFYIHAIVSGSMVLFHHYPDLSIMDFNASVVSYRIGLFVYLLSQIVVIRNDNYYIILPSQLAAQYCFLFHVILQLKDDKRHILFKGLMNFLICVAKCSILYYLSIR